MRDKIINFINKQNWNYLEKNNVIKIDIEGKSLSWTSYIKADENDSFSFFSILPAKADKENLEDIAVFLHEINTKLWFGNFELISKEPDIGQIRFRTSCYVPPMATDEVIEALIGTTLNFNLATVDYYGKEILSELL